MTTLADQGHNQTTDGREGQLRDLGGRVECLQSNQYPLEKLPGGMSHGDYDCFRGDIQPNIIW